MNRSADNLPNLDPQTLDEGLLEMLVDGELTEADRRQVLLALEDVPQGWRRCALAFLEVQCMRDSMRSMTQETTTKPQAARSAGSRSVPGGLWGTLAAMAACFLIALGLGFVWHGALNRGISDPTSSQLAGSNTEKEVSKTKPHDSGSIPASDFPDNGPPWDDPDRNLPESRFADSRPGSWQVVTVPVSSGPDGTAESIRIPAVERDRLDERWTRGFPRATLPGDILEALQQSGHRVQRHRQFLHPVPLDDGRQLVVPVDEVEVRYVGDAAYQ